ncbi:MAG: efflux RND transporter periplasmic adaptor subunit, partial [Bacteroides sp.]|nr:efflux RND transporter periplasmic adaptor subunit [Bacteroides sp.]
MKNIINKIKENYKLSLGIFIIGLFLGWLLFHPSKDELRQLDQIEGHEGHDHASEDPTTWTCSMHPQIKQDKPGLCPICAMDLIPVATAQSSGENMDPDEIVLSESAAKLADIQTQTVSYGMAQKTLYLQGKVHADERNMAELTARFGGRIEKLFVNFTGQNVQKGEKLATIYSPDLITAQRELLEAASFKENRPSFYTAARAKLKLWDLSDDQIAAIEEEGEPQLYFDVLSPISGTVMMRHVALGDYVKEGSALFQLTDLRKVWVMFDAYESDLPWIKTGDHVLISIQAIPGKEFEGRVAFIDPFINPKTRIARVRIELANSGLSLKPEMFASGVLQSNIGDSADHLLIPKSSILWTGKRAVVYVRVPERESPSFIYREITLGPEAGNFYVVAKGLAEGEIIAVNGVFKIDAAAQLEGKPSMMNPGGGKVSLGHDHGAMSDSEPQAMEAEQSPVETKAAFKKQLQAVYDSYILMNGFFVGSDAKGVGKAASDVKSKLQEVDMSLLEGEAHMIWMKHLKTLESEI